MAKPWVPTVDDLRVRMSLLHFFKEQLLIQCVSQVKLCYICREEEAYDKPEDPPRAWTHPCNCTLVAHESCLLHWITAAQQNPERAANALKCPQCGARYELESKNPPSLRALDALNRSLSHVGKIVTASCVGLVVLSFGAGVYAICTSYGSYAIRNFLGKEMYNVLLSDDPSTWPWHAFLNLPLIPITLIVSRTPLSSTVSPLIPLLFSWCSSTPNTSVLRSMNLRWQGSENWLQHALYANGPTKWWPPSPTLLSMMFPLVRAFYGVGLKHLKRWVVNSRETPQPPVRRIEWALNDGGPAALRIRIGANVGQPAAERPAQPPDPDAQQEAGQAPADAPEGDAVNEEDPGVAAERTIRITGGSIGRVVGGALILPLISNGMGSLLFRLSRHLPILAKILAVRPPLSKTLPSLWPAPSSYGLEGRPLSEQASHIFKIMWQGSRIWAESDPVWWRNALGLGIFIVVKDAVKLFHLWLAKQELESRKVKTRSFEGIDIKELDLINSPPYSAHVEAIDTIGPK
ncbi:hypothetical protein EW146_g7632 [Bondarzewia mesenterica]|uniref:RING-CH-type domain-containing protein n=1 Tax=Bondarzewia mesenterica TaxID=1095465 RepID=A0A4S4LQW2_9AGAM|nr:hypothetical protein EW146_g7632 [Bondarzewia mesenterica]